jgi:hypothetical protein
MKRASLQDGKLIAIPGRDTFHFYEERMDGALQKRLQT